MRCCLSRLLFAALQLVLWPWALAGERGRYGDPAYWEQTYSESGENSTYEWMLKSEDFVALIRPHVRQKDRLLQLGCGNSRVAEVLAAEGFADVTSVDVSPSVINASRAKYQALPALKFVVGDVFALSEFSDGAFDAAVDKGTWDAIPKKRSKDMLREVRRVLGPGAAYLVLTFSRPLNALDFLLDWRVGWKVEDILWVPNPLHDGRHESLKYFYLYVCRNEDRPEDWGPPEGASPEVVEKITNALEFQRIDRRLSGREEL